LRAACSSCSTAALRAAAVSPSPSVASTVDQLLAALRVVEQVVLQVGVAAHHPDVAEHLVQHARRAPGLARAAQLVEQLPRRLTQQADHDFAV